MSVDTRIDHDIAVSRNSILEVPNSTHAINPLMAVLNFAWRAILRMKHVPEQLLDVVFFPLMFILTMAYVLGGAIAGTPEDYLQYALAGVLSQSLVFLSIYTALNVNTDIPNGALDRFRTLPAWRPSHLVGTLAADLVRYGIAAALGLTTAFIVGYRAEGGVAGVLAALGVLFMFCFAMSWMWLIVGLKARTPSAVQGILFITVFPLTFVSSMFVPPETMPTWLEAFVNVNPMTFLADAVRSLMDGNVDVYSVVMVGLISVGLIVVCAPTALWIYNRSS